MCLSALLHLALLGLPAWWARAPERPRPLQARLAPAELLIPSRPADDLLKDTLAKEEKARKQPAAAPKPREGGGARRAFKPETATRDAAQRKLAEHLYYPDEAVRRGLEGEVRLLLVLDASGRVLSAEVAAGSGHAILDEAARAAALAMGSLPDAGAKELILPVVFRLQ
ncbi:MAG: TonB family protein [Rhodocyclaceae bacterium]|nr:TonB family protein [Rhodocyclaceae bacterium]